MRQLAMLLCVLLGIFSSVAQTETNAPIIFIYDASGSMWGQMDGKTKMEIASEVLSKSINEFSDNQKIGLVAYGHRKKGDCRDVETLLPMENESKSKVSSAVKAIKPLGKTPLAYATSTVIDALRKNKQKATIILITDGIESCDGNICDVVKAAKSEGIDFKLHIVGFGLKEGETEQLKCAAASGDGEYYDAADASGLGDAMGEVVNQTIDKKEGNFGVYALKNGKPIDAHIKAYKAGTKEPVNTLRTYGETRYMYLPSGKYDLEAQPVSGDVERIYIMDQESFDDKKTERTISFDGGKVEVYTTNNNEGWDAVVKLSDENGKVISSTRTYGVRQTMEINPGVYKANILILKIEGMEVEYAIDNIIVTAGEITKIAHNFQSGTLMVYTKLNGENIDTVTKIKEIATGKVVAASRTYDRGSTFLLNPDMYTIMVQPLGKNKELQPKEVDLKINTGESNTKTFNW